MKIWLISDPKTSSVFLTVNPNLIAAAKDKGTIDVEELDFSKTHTVIINLFDDKGEEFFT